MRALLLTSVLALALAPPAPAQEKDRAAEVKELEALLAKLDAALAATKTVAEPATTLELYDVRTLLSVPPDRAAPLLVVAADAAGYQTGAGAPAGGAFSFDAGKEEEEGSALDSDKLVEVLTNAVGEEQWDEPRSIESHRGLLIVRQTALGHVRIRKTLDALFARAGTSIQLEVGFWHLGAELREEVRKAGLANDGVLPPEMLQRLEVAAGDVKAGARLVGATLVSALDGQRVYLHQGSERTYVADFELSSGGTGQVTATVPDPRIEVLRTGLAVDARPTLVQEGGRKLVALDVRFVRCRPGPTGKRATPYGPLDTPQVTTDGVRTSARVPTGAGMLVYAAEGGDAGDEVTIVVRPRIVER